MASDDDTHCYRCGRDLFSCACRADPTRSGSQVAAVALIFGLWLLAAFVGWGFQ